MTTTDFIQAIRQDVKSATKEELLAEIMPIIEKRLYANVFTLHQAAKYLNISEATLRRMVKDEQIPSFRIRGQIHFRQTDIDCWIDSQVKENYSKKG
ncbi:helix-turn-helix domain-containing protein [Paenibacillus eucommiae]|uniref:Excisionase family DNA binding protein n=1 Tax=Paenibacillus eucommiae TaxID=1355755 RepID=A0ABS4IZU5_9BACL|nr:helix-turn-helix domain-containing protein [Paenibacillus eucommiae]MBP1992521.1 excisionase family DNA binding protein [Paenibacillus eucommiae]